jgi:multidrug resistance efflux pump
MIFIHADDKIFSAAFPQSVVQRLQAGATAEIAFDAIPGRVFGGKVNVLIDAVSQGQLQPSGALLNPEDHEAKSNRLRNARRSRPQEKASAHFLTAIPCRKRRERCDV